MNDLLEMELNGFTGAWQMARRLGALRPRPRPLARGLLTAGTRHRKPIARPMVTPHAVSPKAARIRAIVASQFARKLGPALSGVIAAAAQRKLAVSHGEQIEMPDVARKLRDYKARLWNFLVSPAVMAVARTFNEGLPPTSVSSAAITAAVTFAAEKLKERGVLNNTETEAIKQLAPEAIDQILPAIIEQVGKLRESESESESEAENDMLTELESRW